MLYEVAHITNGDLYRGGIKAPIPTVEEWIRKLEEVDHETEYFVVPANEKSNPRRKSASLHVRSRSDRRNEL